MKAIIYLRTDISNQELIMGGSVAHTLGVINGFSQLGYQIICASSCMQKLLTALPILFFIPLQNPKILTILRWKINCFLSSFLFFFILVYKLNCELKSSVKVRDILFIYQRYSLLNMTGLLIAWWYKKKLILEYNGSESWIATYWVQKKRWMKLTWLMEKVEQWNVQYADLLVVVSEVLKSELLKKGVSPSKILVNPNGVDSEKFCAREKRESNVDANNNNYIKKNLERYFL